MIYINIFSSSSRGRGKVDNVWELLFIAINPVGKRMYNYGEETGYKWTSTGTEQKPSGESRTVHSISPEFSTIHSLWKTLLSPTNPQVFHKEVA